MTLIALERLSCGCVAGVYRANPAIVEVEMVEAKGPHCRYYSHRSGEVIALGASDEIHSDASPRSTGTL